MLEYLQAHLQTRWAGRGEVAYEPVMNSTNIRAKEMARAGAPHGSLAVCDHQTAGRGRMTRRWETPAGEALTQSMVLRPRLPVEHAPLCTFAAALAAAKAIEKVCPEVKPGIKWPNDVVIGSKKCVGILCEMVLDGGGYAVVPGVGININQKSFEGELADKATSLLMETGKQQDRWQVLCAYLQYMEQAIDALEEAGLKGIWQEYASRSVTLGSRVRVIGTDVEFMGTAKAVDETGALIVTDENGVDRRVLSGDVSVRGLMGYVDEEEDSVMKHPVYEGSITDVQGILVGQAQNEQAMTGVTVVLAGRDGATIGADVRGAAPGTRETDLCKPENTVDKAHAVVLSGGSAFGLASATGVMEYLEQQNIGVDMGVCHVPIVPAAVVFDLMVGDGHVRPDAAMGVEACKAAAAEVAQGAVGAGTGATVGKMVPGIIPSHGGVGTASMKLPGGVTVGAIVVVNACGDVYDLNGQPIGVGHLPDGTPVPVESVLYGAIPAGKEGQNTTIGVVATDAVLTKAQAKRMATCAHDGLARTIRPVHTQMDGDTIFALGTGEAESEGNLFQLCAAAAEVMARAVVNAVTMGAAE